MRLARSARDDLANLGFHDDHHHESAGLIYPHDDFDSTAHDHTDDRLAVRSREHHHHDYGHDDDLVQHHDADLLEHQRAAGLRLSNLASADNGSILPAPARSRGRTGASPSVRRTDLER
jgi:hypothetical protein